MPTVEPRSPLTPFQLDVAAAFFDLPVAGGFLLAGGAALAAVGLTNRPTQDLDFFTSPGRGDVPTVRDAFTTAARALGWTVDVVRDGATFCRLHITGPDEVLVDIALDSTPGRPPTASIAGPTYDPAELAGRKVIALFDRAAARDFVDVHQLTRTYHTDQLLALAEEVDAGFDPTVLAEMITRSLPRYTDRDLALGHTDVNDLRHFFTTWANQIRQSRG